MQFDNYALWILIAIPLMIAPYQIDLIFQFNGNSPCNQIVWWMSFQWSRKLIFFTYRILQDWNSSFYVITDSGVDRIVYIILHNRYGIHRRYANIISIGDPESALVAPWQHCSQICKFFKAILQNLVKWSEETCHATLSGADTCCCAWPQACVYTDIPINKNFFVTRVTASVAYILATPLTTTIKLQLYMKPFN